MTGKWNVLTAMRSGARLFIGGYSNFNRLVFKDGTTKRVHGSTVQAVIDTGWVHPAKKLDPWSPMSQEYVLKG
jgi:hypothetical protein